MSLSRRLTPFLLVTGAMAIPIPAFAGGFYLQEQSPKETGRALSGGAAAGDDPSTIYFNPAAMTELQGVQLSAGASALRVASSIPVRRSTRSPAACVRSDIARGSC